MTDILVDDFGPLAARGDGETDDSAAIQLAIQAGIASNRPVRFGARTYVIKREIVIDNFCGLLGTSRAGDVQRIGSGDGRTVLKAGAAMRACLVLRKPVQVSNLHIVGDRKAQHGMLLQGCSESAFRHVSVSGCLSDGVLLEKADDDGNYAINDTNVWEHFSFGRNGTLHHSTGGATGSPVLSNQRKEHPGAYASTVAGSGEVELDGIDLEAIGVRRGDPLTLDGKGYMVSEVLSATRLRVSEPATASATSVQFAIGIGDGYREERHGDNNMHGFSSGLVRGNAGNGMSFDGLYGPDVRLTRFEYQGFWGVRVGSVGGDAVIGSQFSRCYFESNAQRGMVVRSAAGIGVYHPNAPPDLFDYGGHPENVHGGILVSTEGVRSIGPEAGIKSHLYTDRVVHATIEGRTNLKRAQVWPALDATIPVNAPVVQMMSPGDLVGKPTLEIVEGRTVILCGGADVTLHDQADLAGTKLRLSTPTVTLRQHDMLTLYCVGGEWREVARAVR